MKKGLTLLVIVAAMVALVSWKKFDAGHNAIPVKVELVSQGVLSDTVLASGNFVFNEQIKIRPEVSGRVQSILIDEGDYVRQGQLLLQLDPVAFEAEVERVSAQVANRTIEIARQKERLSNLQRQLKRNQQLLKDGLVQQETVDDLQSTVDIAHIDVEAAQTGLKQAQASLSFAQDQLAKTAFIAPMDGLIASLDIKEGETVIAGTTNIIGSDLMTVADPSAILAELRVDEADIANIQLQQSVEIYAAAYPKTAFNGRVVKIGTSAKQLGNTPGLAFKVEVLMDPSETALFPGMSCRAEIITASGDTTNNVPIAAIQYEDEDSYVWVVKNGRSMKMPVTLGMATDTQQAIISGLENGDEVIIGPARTVSKLKENDQVEAGENS
ncbi:MAG: efflux RND transporter periplasmic adaptor subunit [Alteromonadaceae bacterium]|nr:efflux RND transporter periplasmic adaptor subunit [Alteromonadaceae bacterium]